MNNDAAIYRFEAKSAAASAESYEYTAQARALEGNPDSAETYIAFARGCRERAETYNRFADELEAEQQVAA